MEGTAGSRPSSAAAVGKGKPINSAGRRKIEAHNGMPLGSLTDEQLEENAEWLGYHRKHWKWKED